MISLPWNIISLLWQVWNAPFKMLNVARFWNQIPVVNFNLKTPCWKHPKVTKLHTYLLRPYVVGSLLPHPPLKLKGVPGLFCSTNPARLNLTGAQAGTVLGIIEKSGIAGIALGIIERSRRHAYCLCIIRHAYHFLLLVISSNVAS